MIRNTYKGQCFLSNKKETLEVPKWIYSEISKLETDRAKLQGEVEELKGDVRMWRSKYNLKEV